MLLTDPEQTAKTDLPVRTWSALAYSQQGAANNTSLDWQYF
jgi:hypothetical protein